MVNALAPASAEAGAVSFALDRFEVTADRVELSGRWFGVRGRRFIRPTLIFAEVKGQSRVLADLEHKPWAAQDGEPWEAAFPIPLGHDAELPGPELAVAPDITIPLPPPSDAAGDAQRISALPRPRRADARPPKRPAKQKPSAKSAAVVESPAVASKEPEALERELAEAREQAERLRGELEQAQAASAAAAAALEEAQVEAAATLARRDSALSSLDEAVADRDSVTEAREHAVAERDRAAAATQRSRSERDRAISERDQATSERDQATSERDQAISKRDQAISKRDELAGVSARLQAELSEAISARGAALVMRDATRTSPERDAGWVQRTLAVVVLLVALFALLIVLHLL